MKIGAVISALLAITGLLDAQTVSLNSAPPLRATESMRIGKTDGGVAELRSVTAVAFARNGEIFVLDATGLSVKVFGSSGQYSRTFGRGGQGPGEFETPLSIGFLADTLWVADYSGRVSFFDVRGSFLRSVSLPAVRGVTTRRAPVIVAPGGRGIRIVTSPFFRVATDSVVSAPVLLFSRDGQRSDTLLSRHIRKGTYSVTAPAGGTYESTDPFNHDALLAVSPHGTFVAVVERPAPVNNVTVPISVRFLSTTGSAQSNFALQQDALRATAAMRTDLVRGIASSLSNDFPSENAARAAVDAAMPRGLYFPRVLGARIGTDSTVWLNVPLNSDDDRWIGVDRRGAMIGMLGAEFDSQLRALRRDQIWVVASDSATGIPQLVKYTISRQE